MKSYARYPFVALLAAGAASAAAAAAINNPAEATQALQRAGYSEVRELEMDDGLYEADVRLRDGSWTEVHVDPASGAIYDANDTRAQLDADAIRTALAAAGYEQVGDLEREGALWDAEATTRDGKRVDLRVSATDGRVVSVEDDALDD